MEEEEGGEIDSKSKAMEEERTRKRQRIKGCGKGGKKRSGERRV